MCRLPAPDHPSKPPSPRRWPGATLGAANEALHPHIVAMQDTEQFLEDPVDHAVDRKERLEQAITEALQREAARHEAAVKNMHRLRALRLERDQKTDRDSA